MSGEVEPQRPKLTRDEAAKYANLMLAAYSRRDASFSEANPEGVISLKSRRELGEKRAALFQEMGLQLLRESQTVSVQSEGDKTATVVVESNATPPARPLVLVEEDGGWGVDLVETYAKWNNLQGVAKAEAIYKLTGAVLDELPRNAEFIRRQCQTNLKQIALGMAQYIQDYDEKFPIAKGWTDNLQPYIKSEAIFNCPALPKGQKYGYAYNSKLATKWLGNLADISKVVSIYETSELGRGAFGMGGNPAFRHEGGANYAFADGHIKWFSKTQTPSFNIGKLMRNAPQGPIIAAPPA